MSRVLRSFDGDSVVGCTPPPSVRAPYKATAVCANVVMERKTVRSFGTIDAGVLAIVNVM